MSGLSARCANHPQEPAEAVCTRCGDFVCGQCFERSPTTGELFCTSCLSGHVHAAEPLLWEQRAQEGWGSAFVGTVKESLLDPTGFFKKVDPEGGTSHALIYSMICWGIGMVIGMAYQGAVVFGLGPDPNEPFDPFMLWRQAAGDLGEMGAPVIAGAVLGIMVLILITLVAYTYLRAGFMHLAAKVIGAANYGFAATYRATNYTSGVYLLNSALTLCLIPFIFLGHEAVMIIGILAGLAGMAIWMYDLFMTMVGLREVHRMSTGQAIGTIAVYVGFFVLLFCCTYGVIIGAVFAMLAPGMGPF